LSDPLWTPVGSSTGLLVLLAVVTPLIVSDVIRYYRENADMKLVGSSMLLLLVATGAFVTLYRLIPQINQIILPVRWAWTIVLEAFKDPRTALFGVGIQNYLAAFTNGRPVGFNTTPLWNVRFVTGSTYFLHLTTTNGLFGILAVIVLLRSLWNTKDSPSRRISSLIAMIALLIAPPSLAAFTAIVGLRMANDDEPRKTTVPLTHNAWVPAVLVTVTISIVLAASFFVGKVYAAELAFYRSLLAAQRNNGTETYNLQRQVLQLNPQMARYHIAYSQTNLAIANALALSFAAEATQSARTGELDENNRQLIATLVQQAIREGKVAVNLAPTSVIAWENLARIYQSLTPIAQGADAWAIASYQQAVALDPTNPILRLDLGGMYIRQENYDSAIQQFVIATQMKLDFSNAHYNLANAYRLNGQYDKAATELEATRVLIDEGSEDHTKVVREIEELEKRKTAESLPSGDTLTTPVESKPLLTPRLSLPEESSPNEPATTSGSE
jgi:tetratricopeptide (TPR) repeat protein